MTARELDTGTEEVLGRVEDGVAVLTLNRPERRNAFSPTMVQALGRTLAEVELDDSVGAVVLTGAGGAFCAGGDVKMMAERSLSFAPGAAYDDLIHHQQFNQRETSGRLYAMPKPTIAMLPGAAAGAGLSLALSCDLRYASDNAILTTAFARVGFSGDYGGTWFMTRLIGSAKAKELYFFSDKLTAAEALDLGLVNAVFSAESLEDEVMTLARRLANGPRIALRYMKENLNRAALTPFVDCSDLEVNHHAHTATTDDHREAALAFVEKREPKFTGR
jgi:2-(1,2-epoxy-1,2-dihydrophenyl)acetyl-CoA isomerase